MIDRAARSARNYEVKLRLGACGRLSEEEIRRRVDGYAYRAYQSQAIHLQVRQVLNSYGVGPASDLMYHAYACELGKLTRRDSFAAREEAMRAAAAKWIARGLHAAALRGVAESVFNLPWPASERKR